MADDDGLKIRHYRATDDSRGAKELITELVIESSDTFVFLERMEEKRLNKPCQLDLDMRDKVSDECKKYRYQGRTFYMDDESLRLYKEMMRDHSGEFTTRIYENIINAKHTFRAMKRAQLDAQQKKKKKAMPSAAAAAKAKPQVVGELARKKDYEVIYRPDKVTLGYYYERNESRLKYATKVQIVFDMGVSLGNTKDVSCAGLHMVIPDAFVITKGTEVTIEFVRLKEESKQTDLSRVPFKVVDVEEKSGKTYVRMKRGDLYEATSAYEKFMEGLKQRYGGRYKFCVEDVYKTHTALLLEKLYFDNMAQIPLFIGQSKKGKHYLQLVGRSLGNAHVFACCERAGGFDLSLFTLPERLEAMLKGEDFFIAAYRSDKSTTFKTHSIASYECDSVDMWENFIRYALTQQTFRMFKISGVAAVSPDFESKKMKEDYEQYEQKFPEEWLKLHHRLQELHSVGVVIDVSSQIEEVYQFKSFDTKMPSLNQLNYWFGRKFIRQGKVVKSSDKLIRPHFMQLAYRKSRVEERFFVEVAVSLKIEGKAYEGRTKDLSTYGLQVQFTGNVESIECGDEAFVALVSLQKKRAGVDLGKIPYHVVKVVKDEKEDLTFVMLFRHNDGRTKAIDGFFRELIKTNEHKLSVCTHDWHSDIVSRTYETMCAQHLPSVPLFLSKEESGSIVMKAFAVGAVPNDFARFFELEGEYDFSCLNKSAMNAMIYQQIVHISREAEHIDVRPAPCEVLYYLSKEYDEVLDHVAITAKADIEFKDNIAKDAYLQTVRDSGHDYRWVKLAVTYAAPLRPAEIDVAVDMIRNNDKNRSFQLREFVFQMVGVGELTDVTDVFDGTIVQ